MPKTPRTTESMITRFRCRVDQPCEGTRSDCDVGEGTGEVEVAARSPGARAADLGAAVVVEDDEDAEGVDRVEDENEEWLDECLVAVIDELEEVVERCEDEGVEDGARPAVNPARREEKKAGISPIAGVETAGAVAVPSL